MTSKEEKAKRLKEICRRPERQCLSCGRLFEPLDGQQMCKWCLDLSTKKQEVLFNIRK